MSESDGEMAEYVRGRLDDIDATASTNEDRVDAYRKLTMEMAVEINTLQQTIGELREEMAEFKHGTAKRINELSAAVDGDSNITGTTTLEKYASMDSEEREEVLGVRQRRAVHIYLNWQDLSEKLGKGFGVTTKRNSVKRHQPSRFRLEYIDVLPDDLLNDDGRLEWTQIKRAMQEMASLSGGKDDPEARRKKIVQGEFVYEVRTTPDNTNSTTYHVLWEATE